MRKYLLIPVFIIGSIVKFFITYIPGEFGFYLRYHYYKLRFKSIGVNVRIDIGVHIDGAEHISIGSNVYIDKYCIISTGTKLIGKIKIKDKEEFLYEPGEVIIGNNIHIAQFCILMGYGGVVIGDNSVMSAGCKVYSLTNTPNDPEYPGAVISIQPYEQAPFLLSPVILGENVWLGLNVIIMPSVHLNRNSFCTSNSLILNSFSENSYLSGQPAIRIRKRFENHTEG